MQSKIFTRQHNIIWINTGEESCLVALSALLLFSQWICKNTATIVEYINTATAEEQDEIATWQWITICKSSSSSVSVSSTNQPNPHSNPQSLIQTDWGKNAFWCCAAAAAAPFCGVRGRGSGLREEGSEEGYNNKQRDNLPHHSSPPTTTTTTQRQECISFSAEEAVESSFSGCHCFSVFPVYVAVSAIYGQNILIFLSIHPLTPTKPGDTLFYMWCLWLSTPSPHPFVNDITFIFARPFYLHSSLLYAHQPTTHPASQPTNRTYLCFWCLTYNLFWTEMQNVAIKGCVALLFVRLCCFCC